MKIGIVAGEPSGDYLGAGLMSALKQRFPDIDFIGIGGPQMEAQGMRNLYPMERISVMGLDNLFRSLFDILRIRRSLFNLFVRERPAAFIGVDVPDFNIGLEQKLRRRGITTVHYVSPTVWAWRGYRIRKIKRAVSHMLTLFPFEADFYRRHRVPVSFVGHPIADTVDMDYDKQQVRRDLGIECDGGLVVALLPGSRMIEIKRLGDLFLQTARALRGTMEGLVFVAPFANPETKEYFSTLARDYPDLGVHLVAGRSRQVIAAADVALLASGTAALEAALLKVPMIVTYRGSWVSYALVKLLAHVDHFSMPNNLLEEPIVPELIQSDASVEKLSSELLRYLRDPGLRASVSSRFGTILNALRCGANDRAAAVIGELIQVHSNRGAPGPDECVPT